MIDLSTLPGYRQVLDKIQAAWEETSKSRRLQVIILEGESGSDKTGVVETFLATSQAPAIRCRGAEIPESYLPLRRLFESILELNVVQKQLQKPSEQISNEWQMALTALARLLPLIPVAPMPMVEALTHWTSSLSGSSMIGGFEDDEPSRPMTLPGLLTVALGELSARTPLSILIDNLDLADDATIEALTLTILPALKESAVLFIIAMEPAKDPKRVLSDLIHWMENEPFKQRLALPFLGIDDIESILHNMAPELNAEKLSSVATQIHRVAGGNLAQIQDITHWLKRTNDDILTAAVRASDHTVIYQEQFARLPMRDQEILQIASIQGTMFCSQVLASVFDKSNDEIVAVLDQIKQQADVFIAFDTDATLQETTLHWYHFRGRRTREWVYTSIARGKQAAYHREVGQALEALYGDATVSIAGLLAQQFERGEVPEKAAHYYAEIARQANEQGAENQALEYAQCGLSLLVDQDQALQGALLLQQGRALMSSEQSHLAEDIFRQAIEVAREAKTPQLEMELSYYLGELLLNRNIWDEGVELVERALKSAAEQKTWAIVVDGMEKLRRHYTKQRDPQAFLNMCDQKIELIRGDTSPEAKAAIAEILEDKAWLYNEKRKHPETLETLQRAFEYLNSTSSSLHFPEIRFKLYRLYAQSLRTCENYSDSLDMAEKALSWAQASNIRANIARAHETKATTLRQMGRIAEGEQEYEIALTMLNTTSDLITLAEVEGFYGLFLSHSGRKRRAKEFYEKSYAHRQEIGYRFGLQTSRNNLAAMYKELGQFQKALSIYQQLYSEGVAEDDKSRQSLSLNHIGDIHRILGNLDESERAHQQAIRLCEAIGQQDRKTITLRYLGQTFLCGWQLDKAQDNLGEAEAMIRSNKVASSNRRLFNQLFLGRLALCKGKLTDSFEKLASIVKPLHELKDELLMGIAYLNLSLLLLAEGNHAEATETVKNALQALGNIESWRIAEAQHLLARCYLAAGNLERAFYEAHLAKDSFMNIGLLHRRFQVESTELHIQDAQESEDWTEWQYLNQNELLNEFNCLGI
ncbi:MAG: tetratricopeptide repeat protein [Anaerolineae bacterium]|nr:tetratricopeptide repeat protein [Anaerolineae bacterium]